MKPYLCLIIVGLAILCYVNVLHSPFMWDDLALQPTFHVNSFHDVLRWDEDRPALMMSYRLNGYFSQDPFYFHLTNLFLHVINCLLVYMLCFNVSQGRGDVGFAGAAIFAVHPLMSEAVVSIAGRSSLLCATFYFAALLCAWKGLWAVGMVKIAKNSKHKDVQIKYTRFHLDRMIGYLLAFGLFATLAFYTKPEAATLIPVVLMMWWIREGWTAEFLAVIVACGIAVFIYSTTFGGHFIELAQSVQRNTELQTAGLNSVLPMRQFVPTYVVSLASHYYLKMLVPFGLSVDPAITIYKFLSWEFVGVAAMLAFFALCLFDQYRSRPFRYAMACLLISPISAYALFPIADPILEHRAYISGLAMALFFGLFVSKLSSRKAEVVTVGAIVLFAVLTISHNAVWDNPLDLWSQAVSVNPTSPRARTNLGREFQVVGDNWNAVRQYNYALDLKPDDYAAETNLAGIYLDTKQFAVASSHLEHVTAVAPEYPEGWINYAVLLLRTGRSEDALKAINTAIRLKPQPAAFVNKVDILRQLGRTEEANALEKSTSR